MFEAIIWFLIWVLVVAGIIYIVVWVLKDIAGLPIPPKIIQIVWVIFALIVILLLVRMLLPLAGGHHLLR